VRAAVEALFVFNGVTVNYDEETGKLVTSGNTDAIIQQDDTSVTIQGENGEIAGVGIANAELFDGEMIAVSALLEQYPDLTLPVIPAGYLLQEQAQVLSDGTLVFTWSGPSGHIITYQRSTTDLQGLVLAGDASGVVPNSGSVQEVTVVASSAESSSGMAPAPVAIHTWESRGYFHTLIATDPEITESDLQAMHP